MEGGRKAGGGAFSSVRSITHRQTKEKRAVNTIHKKSIWNEEERDMVFIEVSLLQSMNHPNILRLHEFYQDEKNYYIICELCSGRVVRSNNKLWKLFGVNGS